MKPVVLASWEDANGVYCVDILDFRDGSFGYVRCRRDPEDGHGWRVIEPASARRYHSRAAAEDVARQDVPECAPRS